MKLEKIKNHKKIIIGGLITVGIITTLILTTSKAKYKNIETLDLVNGTINYTPADIDLVAIQIENEAGEYEATNTVPVSGYTLNDKSYCNVNGTKDTSITLTYENGLIGISDITKRTKCYLYFDKQTIPPTIETIVGDTTNIEEKIEFTGIATSTDTGIYSAPDDYGTSYYFRGVEDKLNNWVKFAGFYWRIIRINGNGTVRMIYQGEANGAVSDSNKTGTTTAINGKYQYNSIYPYISSDNDNAYVGYMISINSGNSDSYIEAHKNLYDSNAKVEVDKWYKTNIEDKKFGNYVDVNTGFCNDREIAKGHSNYIGGGYGKGKTVYNPADRLWATNLESLKSIQTPTLQCANKERDLFTVSNADEGNKKLTYPVGLITSDEITFAGGFGTLSNSTYYLYTNQIYWTMSPFSYNSSASVFYVYIDGRITPCDVDVYGDVSFRPVINLRADTHFTGVGSESNPFVVVYS